MTIEECTAVDVAFVLDKDGCLCAVMPGLAGTVNHPEECTCYDGQHASGRIDYFADSCIGAQPEWYANLLKELDRIGYDVTVIPFDNIENDEYLVARIKQLER